MITLSGVPYYKKYIILEDNAIGGVEYIKEEVQSYEYENLLKDIVNSYAEPIFKLFFKEKRHISCDEFDINNIDMTYIKEEMLQDKDILKIIVKLFKKYGMIVDTDNNSEHIGNDYVSVKELLYLVNQLVSLYILKIAVDGIEEIKRYNDMMIISDLKYKSKLNQVFDYIFYNVKYDPKIYEKKEKEQYYKVCKNKIVEYINRQNILFEKANKKFIYDEKNDEIKYKQQDYKLLPMLWSNYTESLTAHKYKNHKNPSICPICHKPYYKTSNNQKRCSKHSRDEICKQEKQEMYDKVLEIYDNNRLNKNIKKEIEEKVLNVKNIRQVKKEDLRELLKSQV